MKAALAFVFLASALAEPPVDNRYLPPQSQGRPSQTYGAPGFGSQRQTEAILSRPSSTYGAPNQSNQRRPSPQYGVPSNENGSPGSMAFGAQRPSSQYGAPAPSQSYGTPGFGNGDSFRSSQVAGAQSRQYLPPGNNGYSNGNNGYSGGNNGYDGGNSEPANYNFEYMVKDEASGNDFGHRESRQGDRAEGLYYVLLPDGRKQTVEYEADQDGYKPRISYEDVGTGNGYGRGNQGYPSGYPSQEGPY